MKIKEPTYCNQQKDKGLVTVPREQSLLLVHVTSIDIITLNFEDTIKFACTCNIRCN